MELKKQDEVTLAGFCPELDAAELEQANDNLRRYIALAVRIFERHHQVSDAPSLGSELNSSENQTEGQVASL